MSLNKFRTDPSLAKEGVWVEVARNTDDTPVRFKLARMSRHNPKYLKKLRDVGEVHAPDGDWNLIPEAKGDELSLEVFIDVVLLEWENVQLNDDGVALPYSKENAYSLFGNPEFVDLYEELKVRAQTAATFRHKKLEEAAKN